MNVSLRHCFEGLFTNVLEEVFSEVPLITFNTKITHLGDAPAPLGRVGLRRRGGEKPRVMGYPGDGPAPPTLYPSNCRYSREAANELFTESRRRISMKMSSRRAGLERGSVTQHRPHDVDPPTRQRDESLSVPFALGPFAIVEDP
jgi:hypothetical protein